MTDQELGAEIQPDDPEAGAALAKLMGEKSPAKRAVLVRLVETARELNLHAAGLAPMPAGVIVTKATRRRTTP